MTNLLSQFEAYDSVEEAITAAYLGSRYSRGKTGDARPRMLCVYESTDVCTFLREVLCSAGYNALTTLSIDDARTLIEQSFPPDAFEPSGRGDWDRAFASFKTLA